MDDTGDDNQGLVARIEELTNTVLPKRLLDQIPKADGEHAPGILERIQASVFALTTDYIEQGTLKGADVVLFLSGAHNAILQAATRIFIEDRTIGLQEEKLEREIALIDREIEKINAEIALILQRRESERAQIEDVANDGSLLGAQRRLYDAQTLGFSNDNKQKVAQIMARAWEVQRGTDTRFSPKGTGLENAFIKEAVDSMLETLGGPDRREFTGFNLGLGNTHASAVSVDPATGRFYVIENDDSGLNNLYAYSSVGSPLYGPITLGASPIRHARGACVLGEGENAALLILYVDDTGSTTTIFQRRLRDGSIITGTDISLEGLAVDERRFLNALVAVPGRGLYITRQGPVNPNGPGTVINISDDGRTKSTERSFTMPQGNAGSPPRVLGGIAWGRDRLWILDSSNSRVVGIDPDTNMATQEFSIPSNEASVGELLDGLTADTRGIWLASSTKDQVIGYTYEGERMEPA